MFEKKKIDIDVTEQMNETIVRQDKNGNDVDILLRIPYEQKEGMVTELTSMCLLADDKLGVCYIGSLFDVILNYLFVKYYTDIDVEWVSNVVDYYKLYDYCQVNGLNYIDLCADDYKVVYDYWVRYADSIIQLYEAEHSLGYTVKQLLNTDVDTNNKETRELIEKLIDMKGALIEKEEEGKVLQFGKKKPASIKTGGAKMNLAKK